MGLVLEYKAKYQWNGCLHSGVPVIWRSTTQRAVALSSMEAESYACCLAAAEAQWAVGVLRELKIEPGVAVIRMDSTAAQSRLATDGLGRVRHAAIKLAYTKQLIRDKIIRIEHESTNLLVADLLTKNVKATVELDSEVVHSSKTVEGDMSLMDSVHAVDTGAEVGCWNALALPSHHRILLTAWSALELPFVLGFGFANLHGSGTRVLILTVFARAKILVNAMEVTGFKSSEFGRPPVFDGSGGSAGFRDWMLISGAFLCAVDGKFKELLVFGEDDVSATLTLSEEQKKFDNRLWYYLVMSCRGSALAVLDHRGASGVQSLRRLHARFQPKSGLSFTVSEDSVVVV